MKLKLTWKRKKTEKFRNILQYTFIKFQRLINYNPN